MVHSIQRNSIGAMVHLERRFFMPRQNFMTISVPDTVQEMFNEFVRIKEVTKAAALTDVLEMYMLASDEALYLDLKKKYLNTEAVKDMIVSQQNQLASEDIIFMKLGQKDFNGKSYTEDKTMQLYISDCAARGYTWFSTQSLFFGMSPDKVKYFNQKIRSGENVTILFAGNTILGEQKANDIGYAAEVEEVYSEKDSVPCPEANAVPSEFLGEERRIWLKLKNVREERNIKASMLKITSSGRDLKDVISVGQFHFGYVSFKR